MPNESEKILTKLVKSDVLSLDLSEAISELLEKVSIQRKQELQPSPFQRPKSFKRWTEAEEKAMVDSFLEGTTLDKIAAQLERSCNAIFQRLLLVGLVTLSQPIDFSKPRTKSIAEQNHIKDEKKIEPGRICNFCAERIDPQRLVIQPNTYRCVSCQSDFEQRFVKNMSEKFN